jgi:hypothetical protein
MEQNQQAFLLNKIIGKNQAFENLLSNEDFLKWKDETVAPYLESIIVEIKGADRTQPDWKEKVCEAVIAYQEGKKMYDRLFTLAAKNSELARNTLKQLGEARG